MKARFIILILLSILAIDIYAEDSPTKFFKEGKIWNYAHVMYSKDLDNPSYIGYTYTRKVCEDTIIYDIKCKKLVTDYYNHEGQKFRQEISGGYELGPYIYIIHTGKYPRITEICNFNSSVKEESLSEEIEKIDTICVNGILRKRFTIRRLPNDFIAYCVEGIGYNNNAYDGLLVNSYYDMLFSVYEDGKCIFTKEDFKAPATSVESITTNKDSSSNRIYDLFGNEVKAPKTGNLYIHNHKKFVQK